MLESVSYAIDNLRAGNRARIQRAAGGDDADDARSSMRGGSGSLHAAPLVPTVLWFALVVGALAMVAFCYLFGVENRPAQLVMTAILVGLIAILFAVVDEFASPFSGSVSISDDGWLYLQQRLHSIK